MRPSAEMMCGPSSVRPFVCINSAPTGQISMKFDIGDFHEGLSSNLKFVV